MAPVTILFLLLGLDEDRRTTMVLATLANRVLLVRDGDARARLRGVGRGPRRPEARRGDLPGERRSAGDPPLRSAPTFHPEGAIFERDRDLQRVPRLGPIRRRGLSDALVGIPPV